MPLRSVPPQIPLPSVTQEQSSKETQPFLALSKSATSPRAAADLITRATSASNTFLFTELLETRPVAALATDAEFAAYHELLRIFSYGTFSSYAASAGLPELNDAQRLKLRQLSLLTLARDRKNLNYETLRRELGLESAAQLEEVVIKTIHGGLLSAALDPERQVVQVYSIAPLRDLAPGAVPDMLSALENWDGRCDAAFNELGQQIEAIRAAAADRAKKQRQADQKLALAVAEVQEAEDRNPGAGSAADMRKAGRGYGMPQPGQIHTLLSGHGEAMVVDDVDAPEEDQRKSSKRKL